MSLPDETEFDLPGFDTESPTEATDPKFICFYGPHGHGKTWLGASACLVEDYGPLVIIDTEGSADGTVTQFPKNLLRVKRVHNLKEYQDAIKWLRNNEHPFKTVMVDTFGQVLDWKQAEIWAKPILANSGAEDTQKMWGKLYDYGKVATDALLNSSFRTIITMHEKEERDKLGTLYSRMWVNGQIKAYLPTKPYLTGLMVAETDPEEGVTSRTVWFAPDATRATKSRFAHLGLPHKMVDPTMTEIISIIRGEK